MDSRHYNNEKLKQQREEKGFTQAYIAEQLNVHEMTITRADNGRSVSYELLYSYANLLGCDVKDFIRSSMELAA